MIENDSELMNTRNKEELSSPEIENRTKKSIRSIFYNMLMILGVSLLVDGTNINAQNQSSQFNFDTLSESTVWSTYASIPNDSFSLNELDMYPGNVYPNFFPNLDQASLGNTISITSSNSNSPYALFSNLLSRFEYRQGIDDNFTIRVWDKYGNTMEVVELYDLRNRYYETGVADWDEIDRYRRTRTTEIRNKYKSSGVPADDFTIRWGRKNQILEARKNDEPYIHYELRLAKRLGLSALATEIGTVETFNNDRLVSSVGARGRYQFMPAMLRQYDINRYSLETAGGKRVEVREEYQPLLTMEASLTLVRAYSNAAGHEIPGISSYHAGPGNIYKIYEYYLENRTTDMPTNSVTDAYMWALTSGYDLVSSRSSFKAYSQGYIPSVYGSMRAVEDIPIDPNKTLRCERVEMATGSGIYLDQLLDILARNDGHSLNWGYNNTHPNLYERFRKLNQHMLLPVAHEGVPAEGNIYLIQQTEGDRIKFFLPIGATQILERVDASILNEHATFRYDHTTFLDPAKTGEKTQTDFEYDDLVNNIGHFGFTYENRDKLRSLKYEMESLANRNPTPYRKRQLRIINLHYSLWNTSTWTAVADAVSRYGIAPPHGATFDTDAKPVQNRQRQQNSIQRSFDF